LEVGKVEIFGSRWLNSLDRFEELKRRVPTR